MVFWADRSVDLVSSAGSEHFGVRLHRYTCLYLHCALVEVFRCDTHTLAFLGDKKDEHQTHEACQCPPTIQVRAPALATSSENHASHTSSLPAHVGGTPTPYDHLADLREHSTSGKVLIVNQLTLTAITAASFLTFTFSERSNLVNTARQLARYVLYTAPMSCFLLALAASQLQNLPRTANRPGIAVALAVFVLVMNALIILVVLIASLFTLGEGSTWGLMVSACLGLYVFLCLISSAVIAHRKVSSV